MRVVPLLAWGLDGDPPETLDARLLPLLSSIDTLGSLAAAVAARGLSYRAAWGVLRAYQDKLGAPLVTLEQGRGASLAPLGVRLLEADRSAQERMSRPLQGLALELTAPPTAPRRPAPRLRVAASHDLALAALRDLLHTGSELGLDLSFAGSLDALGQFVAGRVDAAGFHVPLDTGQQQRYAPYLRLLRAGSDRLIGFVDRDQGLIVPRGNPGRLKGFRDVAARQLRFINRQSDSGTRLLIDSLLADAAIDAANIVGYENAEFTHVAVAATVASAGADVGFGLRAAAARYSLGFVPLARERYWLVVRASAIRSLKVKRLIAALQSPQFARIVKRLPGYESVLAGAVLGVDAIGSTAAASARRARP